MATLDSFARVSIIATLFPKVGEYNQSICLRTLIHLNIFRLALSRVYCVAWFSHGKFYLNLNFEIWPLISMHLMVVFLSILFCSDSARFLSTRFSSDVVLKAENPLSICLFIFHCSNLRTYLIIWMKVLFLGRCSMNMLKRGVVTTARVVTNRSTCFLCS